MNQIKVHQRKKLQFALIRYGKKRGDLKDWIKFIGARRRCYCPFALLMNNKWWVAAVIGIFYGRVTPHCEGSANEIAYN